MRKRRRWRRWWWLALLLGGVIIWLHAAVNPVVFNYARAELDALTVQAVNAGVTAVVQADTYGQLTDVRRDATGVIVSVAADVVQMNQVAAAVAEAAQGYLSAWSDAGVPIPWGTFSGIPLLTGRGGAWWVPIQLVGAVNCRFDSTFAAAGINQTQHKITLYVEAVVDVILPLATKRTNVAVQMLFADNIIVGKVPEFWFGAYN